MANHEDNQRAALEEVRAAARAAGETDKAPPLDRTFLLIGALAILGAAAFAWYIADPCASQRARWYANGAGMRECAFHAQCSPNNGKYPHVPAAGHYIWFDDSAPSICQGVKF